MHVRHEGVEHHPIAQRHIGQCAGDIVAQTAIARQAASLGNADPQPGISAARAPFVMPIWIELLNRPPRCCSKERNSPRVALPAPRSPDAELIQGTDRIAELAAPLPERRVLGKYAEVIVEHPVLNEAGAPVRMLVRFAEEAAS